MVTQSSVSDNVNEARSVDLQIAQPTRSFAAFQAAAQAALFGALPLALESGTGSELRNPLGITIVGGLLLSQLLTLYTTPVIYLTMERLRARLAGRPFDEGSGKGPDESVQPKPEIGSGGFEEAAE